VLCVLIAIFIGFIFGLLVSRVFYKRSQELFDGKDNDNQSKKVFQHNDFKNPSAMDIRNVMSEDESEEDLFRRENSPTSKLIQKSF